VFALCGAVRAHTQLARLHEAQIWAPLGSTLQGRPDADIAEG
jgi:hypothetical protein